MSRLKNYYLTGGSDISSWESADWENSGLIWNGSNWVAWKSGSGDGVSNLSDLTINTSKDWLTYGIHNMSYVSAATASGGSIKGTWTGDSIDYDKLTLGSISSNAKKGYESGQIIFTPVTDHESTYTHTNYDSTYTWMTQSGNKYSESSQNAFYDHSDVDHDQTTNFSADEHFTQGSITTVGTIGAGTWEGTAIGYDYITLGDISSNTLHSSNTSKHIDVSLTSPASGEILTYMADNSRWENQLPPMTYSISNIEVSANHNINLTRFDAQDKNVYVWQAAACNSGGVSVSGLSIELLSGSTSVYKTSSAILQQGYPLAVSDGGHTEIRFMYSGTHQEISAISEYGTAFMQVSVY